MATRIIARTVVGAFLITAFCFTWVVFGALAVEREVNEPKGWEPPAIEQCDMELWDRIRYKCPE